MKFKKMTPPQKKYVASVREGISIQGIALDRLNHEKAGSGDIMLLERPAKLLSKGRKMVSPMINAGTAVEIDGVLYLTSQVESALAEMPPPVAAKPKLTKKQHLGGLLFFAALDFLSALVFDKRSN
jgi:hypothetical protein